MPRTCLACASPERTAIDKALAIGKPLREITERYGIKSSSLDRHKKHVALAIEKVQEKREEKFGDSILEQMHRVQTKAWELLGKMELEGDHRGSVVALREVRECMESLDDMLARAEALKAGNGGEMLVVKVVHVGANEMQMTTG